MARRQLARSKENVPSLRVIKKVLKAATDIVDELTKIARKFRLPDLL
jgi:hypothetical protein